MLEFSLLVGGELVVLHSVYERWFSLLLRVLRERVRVKGLLNEPTLY